MTANQKIIAGLGTGVIVGTAAGLLLAPKTGKETRNMVATRAGGLRHKAAHYFGNLRRERVNGRSAEEVEAIHE